MTKGLIIVHKYGFVTYTFVNESNVNKKVHGYNKLTAITNKYGQSRDSL